MPYFRREGHPVVTTQAFLDFVGDHLTQEPLLELPILTVGLALVLRQVETTGQWPQGLLDAKIAMIPFMCFAGGLLFARKKSNDFGFFFGIN